MITSSLRPYPGDVLICSTRKEFKREYRKLFGDDEHGLKSSNRGRMVGRFDDATQWPTYIVWAESPAYLAHEVAHVVLHVFDLAGIDPTPANGEPFCYLLSQILVDAEGKKR